MTPEQLEIYITKLIKEKRPDISEVDRHRLVQAAMSFCKTKETATAFLKGMAS